MIFFFDCVKSDDDCKAGEFGDADCEDDCEDEAVEVELFKDNLIIC